MAETKKKTTTASKTTKKSTGAKTATKSTTKSTAKSAPKTTTKTETKTTTTQKSQPQKSTKKRSGGIRTWGINKISFWCIGTMAILYLIASILAICGVNLQVITALQGVATALAICIVAFLAWKYVRNKQTVWKVLYVVLLLVVLLGIILPLVMA